MIELSKLRVAYGDNVIYDGLDFLFPTGVNVILGASGSGKTTLLRAVCGLAEYGGEIKCDPVATVFQEPCLAPVSVLSNVMAVLRGKDAKQRAMDMLKMCRIDDKANKRATRLSGGEKQRVSLARAFATDRSVLLLDEPFQSLDIGVKRQLYRTLDQLLAAYAKTAVLVTHDADEALLLADRIYVLEGHPAKLSLFAEIDAPRAERDEFSPQFTQLRMRLHDKFVSLTAPQDYK